MLRSEAEHTVCWRDERGVTLVPGKNVAIRFATKPDGAAALTDPTPRIQAVSCKKRKTALMVNPRRPTVHQNSTVQDPFAEMKADKVGPATLPRFKHQWNAVNARPR